MTYSIHTVGLNNPLLSWFWLSLKTIETRKSGLGLPVRAVTARVSP